MTSELGKAVNELVEELLSTIDPADRKLIARIDLANDFEQCGNTYHFNKSIADTLDYLTLDQAKILLFYVSKFGKEVLENFRYNCRAIHWEGNTYYVPTGDIEGRFPDTGNYGMICANGGTCT